MLRILEDVAKRALEAARVLEAAGKQSDSARVVSPTDFSASGENAAALLTAELEVIQASVGEAHGLSREQLEFAHEYYTSGPGRDRKVMEAASTIRKALGKHLLTKKRILSLLRDMFVHSCERTDDIAEEVVSAAQSGGDVMAVLQRAPMQVANRYLQGRIGLGMQELMSRAQVLGATSGDSEYMEQVRRVARRLRTDYRDAEQRRLSAAALHPLRLFSLPPPSLSVTGPQLQQLLQNGQQAVQAALQENATIASMFGGHQ